MHKSFKEKMAQLDLMYAQNKLSKAEYDMWKFVYMTEKNQK